MLRDRGAHSGRQTRWQWARCMRFLQDIQIDGLARERHARGNVLRNALPFAAKPLLRGQSPPTSNSLFPVHCSQYPSRRGRPQTGQKAPPSARARGLCGVRSRGPLASPPSVPAPNGSRSATFSTLSFPRPTPYPPRMSPQVNPGLEVLFFLDSGVSRDVSRSCAAEDVELLDGSSLSTSAPWASHPAR